MSTINYLAIIILAALIHASFQLSVSVLTLLSSHSIGAKRSNAKVLRLTFSFVLGAGIMTVLLLAFATLASINLFGDNVHAVIWAIVCGLALGVSLAIWLFYYRHQKGTMLWVPRGMARFLADRTKATKNSFESFGLGLTSILGELLFIAVPIIISALALTHLPSPWQLVGVIAYSIISLLPLVIVWVLISSGHWISHIQKWRENNKRFLQFAASCGLIVLAVFVYVNQIGGL